MHGWRHGFSQSIFLDKSGFTRRSNLRNGHVNVDENSNAVKKTFSAEIYYKRVDGIRYRVCLIYGFTRFESPYLLHLESIKTKVYMVERILRNYETGFNVLFKIWGSTKYKNSI